MTLDRVSKKYGQVHAVNDATFTIPSNSWCVVTGPNGSGKTTMLELATALQEPTEGRVRIGDVAAGEPAARSAVSYLGDSPAFFSDLSAAEHLEYLAGLFHDPSVIDDGIDVLEQFGLAQRVNDIPETFSRGMKQKTAIALAVARPSSMLLLDEPTRGLDSAGSETLLRLLRQRHEAGATIVTVTHEPERFAHPGMIELRVSEGAFHLT
ncbi:MAG: ABC transporter ATP-binding protein [Gemmatimonadaceae bacterium]|nr:ABC transporter ATP-binding protein [Gemmatimonadaceae bacterium]